jgi:hypothetical protein
MVKKRYIPGKNVVFEGVAPGAYILGVPEAQVVDKGIEVLSDVMVEAEETVNKKLVVEQRKITKVHLAVVDSATNKSIVSKVTMWRREYDQFSTAVPVGGSDLPLVSGQKYCFVAEPYQAGAKLQRIGPINVSGYSDKGIEIRCQIKKPLFIYECTVSKKDRKLLGDAATLVIQLSQLDQKEEKQDTIDSPTRHCEVSSETLFPMLHPLYDLPEGNYGLSAKIVSSTTGLTILASEKPTNFVIKNGKSSLSSSRAILSTQNMGIIKAVVAGKDEKRLQNATVVVTYHNSDDSSLRWIGETGRNGEISTPALAFGEYDVFVLFHDYPQIKKTITLKDKIETVALGFGNIKKLRIDVFDNEGKRLLSEGKCFIRAHTSQIRRLHGTKGRHEIELFKSDFPVLVMFVAFDKDVELGVASAFLDALPSKPVGLRIQKRPSRPLDVRVSLSDDEVKNTASATLWLCSAGTVQPVARICLQPKVVEENSSEKGTKKERIMLVAKRDSVCIDDGQYEAIIYRIRKEGPPVCSWLESVSVTKKGGEIVSRIVEENTETDLKTLRNLISIRKNR